MMRESKELLECVLQQKSTNLDFHTRNCAFIDQIFWPLLTLYFFLFLTRPFCFINYKFMIMMPIL